jgi:hypothetical protein
LTISMASRLGARPVRNIELVTQVVAIATHIRYEPMRRDDGSLGFVVERGRVADDRDRAGRARHSTA